MRSRTRHNPRPALIATVLVFLAALVASACASLSPSPTPIAEPTVAPTHAPTAQPEATAAPSPTDVLPTQPPPTPAPTDPPPTATPAPPAEPPPTSARYELAFEATWSAGTHPTDFPPDPHFSPLIGASHSADARLWQVGELSSPGMRNMAETGGTSPLDTEIEALVAEGTACATISGGGVPVSPGIVKVTLTASVDCPLVSIVTMIAPSPDWFVGVSSLSLLQDGAWVEELTVELLPYDAGTDSGLSYTSPNEPTADPEGIYVIESEPLLIDGTMPSLGKFTFTRLDE